VDDRFYQQKEGMVMGSSLFPIVSNNYIKHFEKWALDSAQNTPSLWLRYVDDTFLIWPHGAVGLQNFLIPYKNFRPSIQFTMEIESKSAIPFLDVLIIRKMAALTTKVYKRTHPHWPIS
jgi:hypothetical protein